MFLKKGLLEIRITLWALIVWLSSVTIVTSAKSWSFHNSLMVVKAMDSKEVEFRVDLLSAMINEAKSVPLNPNPMIGEFCYSSSLQTLGSTRPS